MKASGLNNATPNTPDSANRSPATPGVTTPTSPVLTGLTTPPAPPRPSTRPVLGAPDIRGAFAGSTVYATRQGGSNSVPRSALLPFLAPTTPPPNRTVQLSTDAREQLQAPVLEDSTEQAQADATPPPISAAASRTPVYRTPAEGSNPTNNVLPSQATAPTTSNRVVTLTDAQTQEIQALFPLLGEDTEQVAADESRVPEPQLQRRSTPPTEAVELDPNELDGILHDPSKTYPTL